MAQKIQIRHDTAANWTSVNPTLMVGEQGYETDTGKVKVGDGGTSWASLPYNLVAGNVSGTVPIANGGTGQTAKAAAFDALSPTAATGDVIYFGATSNVALAGNTTTTKKFLTQTGTGTVGAAPAWGTIAAGDVPTLNQNTTGTAANITGTAAILNGGTGQTTAGAAFDALSPCTTTGDVIYYNGTHNVRLGIGSSGQVLGISGGVPAWTTPSTGELSNKLLNSDFRFWQASTAPAALVWAAGNPTQYGPDQWYARNALNGGTTAGQLTFTRTTGSLNGSLYGCQLKITTAPVGTPANGCELYQVLENTDSLALYNQTASFGISVKALGNVTQVGIQFVYMTSETKATGATVIGSETLTTVNSAGFTLCQILGQALGTSMTTAGIVGVRIRITGVSTGNAYDLNNGFIVEQAMLNLGSTLGAWKRNGASIAAELASLQRFYEKSFLVDTNPAANITATTSATTAMYFSTTAARTAGIPFKATKRANPTMTFYSTQSASTGAADYISISGSATTNAGINNILAQVGQAGFDLPSLATGSIAQCIYVTCNWVADARI